MKLILGRKIGMTTVFEKDSAIPVTILEAGPCFVSQIKTMGKDGYNSVQIAYGEAKRINKAQSQQLKKAKINKNLKYFHEFKASKDEKYEGGSEIKVDIFDGVKSVDITGISKGHGFSGTTKRHGFSLGPKTHGSKNYRKPGSIGSTGPQRVLKGKKMAGQYGNKKHTVKKLKLIKTDVEQNLLYVKGAVPGANNGIVVIKDNS